MSDEFTQWGGGSFGSTLAWTSQSQLRQPIVGSRSFTTPRGLTTRCKPVLCCTLVTPLVSVYPSHPWAVRKRSSITLLHLLHKTSRAFGPTHQFLEQTKPAVDSGLLTLYVIAWWTLRPITDRSAYVNYPPVEPPAEHLVVPSNSVHDSGWSSKDVSESHNT